MLVLCRPTERDIAYASRDDLPSGHKLWRRSAPFNLNPRGILAHRIRLVTTHLRKGCFSHLSVDYWCGNGAVGEGVCLDEDVGDRLLCDRCEELAVEAGETPADVLVRHHVHVGMLRAVRLCCQELKQ